MDDPASWPKDLGKNVPGSTLDLHRVASSESHLIGLTNVELQKNNSVSTLVAFTKEESGSTLNLQGFVYERLGIYTDDNPDASNSMEGRHRASGWYEQWLGSDRTFSRQPYQHLASVLRAAGDPHQADAVMYAAREREREQKWSEGNYGQAMLLASLRCFIWYGLGYRSFYALYWVILFTGVGIIVLQFSKAARAKGLFWSLGASLDQLLPIIELNKEFGNFFDDPNRERLKNWQLGYFAFQAIVGYVLASCVVAGLAGLTQAQ